VPFIDEGKLQKDSTEVQAPENAPKVYLGEVDWEPPI
jgi:hypothetical protein